jgi:hypothetical protein
MHILFYFLLVGGLTDRAVQNAHPNTVDRGPHCEHARGSIVVLAEGGQGWQGRAADKLMARFDPGRGSCGVVRVLRFDTEQPATAELSVDGADGDLLVLRPRTPLRDAAVTGLHWLSGMPGPRSMILIAHEQFYASAVSTDQLIELAHESKTTIHTVHIAPKNRGGGFFRHLKQAFIDGGIWLFETIGEDEHSYSAGYTARLLKRLASATEGSACVAQAEPEVAACLNLIADRVAVSAQSTSFAPKRQSNCGNSVQEP